ncbi:MAG: hypothetical protein QGH96_15000 [Desulfobacterales bacterium]|jgi:hypothetical protein|nr:hypothetical protein [Desulfobacterales bacterium]
MKLKEHPDIYCRFPVTIGWVILLAGNTICFLFFMKVNNTNIFVPVHRGLLVKPYDNQAKLGFCCLKYDEMAFTNIGNVG